MITLRGQIKSFQGGETPTMLLVFVGKDRHGKAISASLDLQIPIHEVREIKIGQLVSIAIDFDAKE